MAILRKERGREIKIDGAQERTFCIPVSITADAAEIIPLLCSHQDLYLKSAYYVPQTTLAVHADNYRELQLQDRGVTGAGTTVASAQLTTHSDVAAGAALTAFVYSNMTATNGYKLVAGNVLALDVTDVGTTVAMDGLVVIVCK